MSYTVTYLGSQVETTTDNALTIANCTTSDQDALVIFAGGWDLPGEPTVSYGGVEIVGDDWRNLTATTGLGAGIWHKNTVWNGRTDDITVQWGANSSRRFAIAYAITNAGRKDLVKRNANDTETTFANTLLSDPLSSTNEFVISYHLSNGPITDTAGTMASDFTPLHRIGSNLGTNDITIQTGYATPESADAIRSTLTVSTARSFLNGLIAAKPILDTPAIDSEGSELFIGDTVEYFPGTTSIISNMTTSPGHPYVKVLLANGLVYNSHTLTLVGG